MSSISEQIADIVISSDDKVLTDKVISVLVDKGIILENISFEDITDLAEADGDMPYFEFETEAATMAAIEDYLKDCPSYSNIGLRKLLS